MSSASSYPRCALDLHPGRTLSFFSILLILLALLSPWLAGLPVWLAAIADVAALPFARRSWRWARGELARIVWQSDGRWLLTDTAGARHEDVRLLPGAWVHAPLLALRFECRGCGRKFHAALVHDNCKEDELRMLAVRIRLTPDAELFGDQSGQLTGAAEPAKFDGTRTVSRGGCRSSRSG